MLGVRSAAVPASLRRTNQRTVVSLLWRMGTASRADLAKAAGLSQPTAGKIITELMELGILHEVGPNGVGAQIAERRLGRPGQLLALDAENPRFLAIELGVDETCVAPVPVGVKLEDSWSVRFPTPRSPGGWSAALRKACVGMSHPGMRGVLLSVPGIVDETAGKVLFCPNLHWLESADLPALLRRQWNLPVLLVQEIRALALGHLTAEPAAQDFLLVDFGEGVGGAIVLEGQLYSHPVPLSGELGHTPVPGNQRLCGCGAQGCLETLVSERGLLRSCSNLSKGGTRSWEGLVRHVAGSGMEPWLKETLEAAASVIAGALNVLGLHRVVVTGRLAQLSPAVLEHLAAEVRQGALWARFGEVSCTSAPRRRAAGLVAAGLDRLIFPAHQSTVL
jgi:predicted NBD/HSP70 family sugar kinase